MNYVIGLMMELEGPEEHAANALVAVVVAGVIYGVHEVFHMALGHGDLVTNAGSVVFALVAVAGEYAVSETGERQFSHIIAAVAGLAAFAVHTGYWALGPFAVDMAVVTAATFGLGYLILRYLPK